MHFVLGSWSCIIMHNKKSIEVYQILIGLEFALVGSIWKRTKTIIGFEEACAC